MEVGKVKKINEAKEQGHRRKAPCVFYSPGEGQDKRDGIGRIKGTFYY